NTFEPSCPSCQFRLKLSPFSHPSCPSCQFRRILSPSSRPEWPNYPSHQISSSSFRILPFRPFCARFHPCPPYRSRPSSSA
ncbi:hypothetical protein PFISCL1PPCAC_23574, partial [Pristionchus fissidentatus]